MSRYLAQINVAHALDDPSSAIMEEFMENLDRINTLAEQSAGFIWRLKSDESGNATDLQVTPDPRLLINVSIWQDWHSLSHFMYKTDHVGFLKRRKEWFHLSPEATTAFWWHDAADPFPSEKDAYKKLLYLRTHGVTDAVFDLKTALKTG